MSLAHAVVWLDHHHAQVLQFDPKHVEAHKVDAHTHHTRQHGSTVRTEHEFFGEVCAALSGVAEVLATGSHTAQADFRHYVDKHRPAVAKQIVGWEIVDHPSDGQLLASGRKFFAQRDTTAHPRAPGAPTQPRP